MSSSIDSELASRFAAIALGHVARPYPHKADHVFNGPQDIGPHTEHHPIFFGSFDWHSCVHGYWTLATCLRLQPDIPEAGAIRALFDASFTPEKVEAERAYLDRPGAAGFERPYGWAWLLMLAAELSEHDAPWFDTLKPLAEAFAQRFKTFLPKATYPLRAGVHSNTAFALRLAFDYAEACGDQELGTALRYKALDWYMPDRDCQAWEPSGDEFLSPALMEAECLRRLVAGERLYLSWLAHFLPRAAERQPATLFTPATVSDRSDGKIAHLDGLNLSRAWCWKGIASVLPPGNPLAGVAREAADLHLQSALPHVAGDYMGEHWLASFALLALLA